MKSKTRGSNDTAFIRTKDRIDQATENAQARNRLWWEHMPMTYADWEGDDRIPASDADLKDMEGPVLEGSPFLSTQFDFSRIKGKRVLDLGCGSGIFSCHLAKHGAIVTGIDLTEASVGLARRNVNAQGLDVSIVRMDAENMAFAVDSFDYIFSWGVLHHTKDMNKAMSEACRVLKPGGEGMMMVYHRNSIVYYLHGLFWLIFRGKLFAGHSLASVQDFYTDGYYHRYLSARELEGRLERTGLKAQRFHVTQYRKKILPLIPVWLDTYLKNRFGMCLVGDFIKPLPERPAAGGGACARPGTGAIRCSG